MDLRGALIPSKNWEGEVDAVMELARGKLEGFDQGFHTVHARTEDDFLESCLRLSWDINTYCYVNEQQITRLMLEKWSVGRGELVFISSNAKESELPELCSTFRCFDLPSVWPEFWERSFLEQAHMRFIFSLRGKDAFGNQESTFYNEIASAFVVLGKYPYHYNLPCNSREQNCTVQPDWEPGKISGW